MHVYVGLCTAVYGYVWLCRAMYGNVCLCMAMHGYVGLCTAVQGCSAFKLDSSFLSEWSEPFL